MQIEERTVGDVVVLDLKGKITLGEGDELLKDKVNSLVNQGHKKILLNLGGVPYVDSAGLGEIVRTYTNGQEDIGALLTTGDNNSTRRFAFFISTILSRSRKYGGKVTILKRSQKYWLLGFEFK